MCMLYYCRSSTDAFCVVALPCRHPHIFVWVLAVAMVLHVLAVLFTFWSVAFNAFVNYQPVDTLADAEYVQVGG